MTVTAQAKVTSECGNIKKIVFRNSLLYIVWDDDTASVYQYNWVKNINNMENIQDEYTPQK